MAPGHLKDITSTDVFLHLVVVTRTNQHGHLETYSTFPCSRAGRIALFYGDMEHFVWKLVHTAAGSYGGWVYNGEMHQQELEFAMETQIFTT